MESFLLDVSLLEVIRLSLARSLVRGRLKFISCEDLYLLDSSVHYTLFLRHNPCVSERNIALKYSAIIKMRCYFRTLFFVKFLHFSEVFSEQIRLNHS